MGIRKGVRLSDPPPLRIKEHRIRRRKVPCSSPAGSSARHRRCSPAPRPFSFSSSSFLIPPLLERPLDAQDVVADEALQELERVPPVDGEQRARGHRRVDERLWLRLCWRLRLSLGPRLGGGRVAVRADGGVSSAACAGKWRRCAARERGGGAWLGRAGLPQQQARGRRQRSGAHRGHGDSSLYVCSSHSASERVKLGCEGRVTSSRRRRLVARVFPLSPANQQVKPSLNTRTCLHPDPLSGESQRPALQPR